jgi:hypothetical protein
MKLRNESAARELLLRLIRQDGPYPGISVNRTHSMSTQHPIIKKLLKGGLVKTARTGGGKCRKTELVPSDDIFIAGPVNCPECNEQITRSRSHMVQHAARCSVAAISFHWIPEHASHPSLHTPTTFRTRHRPFCGC